MMALRSSVHRMLGETANVLMMGREVRLPYEALLGFQQKQNMTGMSTLFLNMLCNW